MHLNGYILEYWWLGLERFVVFGGRIVTSKAQNLGENLFWFPRKSDVRLKSILVFEIERAVWSKVFPLSVWNHVDVLLCVWEYTSTGIKTKIMETNNWLSKHSYAFTVIKYGVNVLLCSKNSFSVSSWQATGKGGVWL